MSTAADFDHNLNAGSTWHENSTDQEIPGKLVRRHAQRLLTRAAELIEQDGWNQHDYWPDAWHRFRRYVDGDPCCALGALAVAAGIDDHELAEQALWLRLRPPFTAAVEALTTEIARCTGISVTIAEWNDVPERTADEVCAVLRATAESLAAPNHEPVRNGAGRPLGATE